MRGRVRTVAGTFALLLASVGLAAPSAAQAGGGGASEAPRGGDESATIRTQWFYIPRSLDPNEQLNASDNSFTQLLYDSLLFIDGKRRIKPGLATDWNYSNDGLTLTLNLREDVEFADGTTMDSTAVKMSLERAKASATNGPALKNVTSIEAVDPLTVRLNFSKPDSVLLYYLGANPGAVISAQALTEGKDLSQDQSAGTAPYRVVSYEPNTSLTVERRPDSSYWDPKAWRVERFEYTLAADPAATLNAVTTGVVDVVPTLLPPAQVEPRLGESLEYYRLEASSTRNIFLRGTRSNFDDPKVRRAIAMAIDREAICENILDEPYTAQIFPEGDPGHIKGYSPFPYNPDKAKRLIDANGGEFSFETVIRSAAPQDLQIAEVIQENLAAVGVTMNITPVPITDSISMFASGEVDAFEQANAGKADPAIQLADLYIDRYALAGSEAPTLQAMLDEANTFLVGSPERAEALQEAAEFATDGAWQIPMCFLTLGWVADQDIRGIKGMPLQWAAQESPRGWFVTSSGD